MIEGRWLKVNIPVYFINLNICAVYYCIVKPQRNIVHYPIWNFDHLAWNVFIVHLEAIVHFSNLLNILWQYHNLKWNLVTVNSIVLAVYLDCEVIKQAYTLHVSFNSSILVKSHCNIICVCICYGQELRLPCDVYLIEICKIKNFQCYIKILVFFNIVYLRWKLNIDLLFWRDMDYCHISRCIVNNT